MPLKNNIYISAAGSRKTTFLVEEALKHQDKRALITTYTIENLHVVNEYIAKRNGIIPDRIRTMTWFSFLLRECARPYQNYVYEKQRIEGIEFVKGKSAKYIPENKVDEYYFYNGNRIYPDKIAKFACRCNEVSHGLVIDRIQRIYDRILIDESQDLAGYDIDVLEMILRSKIEVIIVADSRQATYFTNCSPKNKKYKGYYINKLFEDWEKKGLCTVEERNECYRSNQAICNYADQLYPEMKPTVSKNPDVTGHDGVYFVRTKDVLRYYAMYKPIILRDNILASTMGLQAMNYGISKGKTFERVLIFPNGPIEEYLSKGNVKTLAPQTKARFYVAITRAKYSVGIVYDRDALAGEISVFK